MVTTKDLFKERMSIRKTNPIRASVLGMLIDTVQKSIREAKREETEADIGAAAKKMYDQTEATIFEYRKGNSDTSELEAELAVLKEFVPASLSPQQMEIAVKQIISELNSDDRTLKNIMPKLKSIAGMDMKSAKAIVEKLIN